jgi:hypothetical protein
MGSNLAKTHMRIGREVLACNQEVMGSKSRESNLDNEESRAKIERK